MWGGVGRRRHALTCSDFENSKCSGVVFENKNDYCAAGAIRLRRHQVHDQHDGHQQRLGALLFELRAETRVI